MPTEIVSTTYLCNICGHEYLTEDDAVECEGLPLESMPYTFKIGDKVAIPIYNVTRLPDNHTNFEYTIVQCGPSSQKYTRALVMYIKAIWIVRSEFGNKHVHKALVSTSHNADSAYTSTYTHICLLEDIILLEA